MNEICSLWTCFGDSSYSDRKNYTIYRKRRLLVNYVKGKKRERSQNFDLCLGINFDFFFLDFAWKINIIDLGLDESLSLRDFLY